MHELNHAVMQLGKRSVCDFALEVSRLEVAAREQRDKICELATTEHVHEGHAQDIIIVWVVDVVLIVFEPCGFVCIF